MTRGIATTTFLFCACLLAWPASAEKVEVAKGIFVTRHTFNAPSNEQPFYGFASKTSEQTQADEAMLRAVKGSGQSEREAFDYAVKLGWRAINAGDSATAARRFNQANIIRPGQASVFHGFAVVAHMRFHDLQYAEELFEVGSHLARYPGYMADYGRLLLVAEKKKEALAVLEVAVEEAPDHAMAWSNLGFARFYDGDNAGACAALDKSVSLRAGKPGPADTLLLRKWAGCS
ncbi:MAG: hypothetical protein H6883_09105 [Rhodobiaceae bacterium]|nr:hypothetical protein [Rhodobiaceae bacterium]MCC0056283.1 hypothetical protein [Rhodobiaceae bacterium]